MIGELFRKDDKLFQDFVRVLPPAETELLLCSPPVRQIGIGCGISLPDSTLSSERLYACIDALRRFVHGGRYGLPRVGLTTSRSDRRAVLLDWPPG